jgi:hypothetical protein
MNKLSMVLALLTLTTLAAPAMAQQQMPCAERSALVGELKEKYKETSQGLGMTGNGAVMELMTSEGGSWSLVVTMPNGKSCLIATGSGWEQVPVKVAGKDA